MLDPPVRFGRRLDLNRSLPALHERRDADAERDAADRVAGELDRRGAAFAGQPLGEAAHQRRGVVAVRVHHGGDDQRQQELQRQHADAADLGDEPARQVAGIRRQPRPGAFDAGADEVRPQQRQPLADHRQ